MNTRFFVILAGILISVTAFSQADKKQYVGTFKFPEGSVVPTITVALEDSVLMMNSSAGASPLTYDKDDNFTIVNFNGTATFKRNVENKINAVHIEAMGYILDGTKDETDKWNLVSYYRKETEKSNTATK